MRLAPVFFALLALICFGGAVLFPEWGTLAPVVLVAMGVVFIVIAVYAWMIL